MVYFASKGNWVFKLTEKRSSIVVILVDSWDKLQAKLWSNQGKRHNLQNVNNDLLESQQLTSLFSM